MRQTARLCLLLAVMLLTQAACAAYVLAADAPAGKLEQVAGGVSVLRAGKTHPAKLADPVFAGDTLSTTADGQATVRFIDDSQLVLAHSSQAKIDTYVYEGASSKLLFKFAKGSFRAVTGKIVEKNPQGFNMQTPLATLGIRGSDVFALVNPAGHDIGALDLGPGHTLQVQTPVATTAIQQGGLVSRVSPTGRISPPAPIPPAMFQIIVTTLAPPQAPPIPAPGPREAAPREGAPAREKAPAQEKAPALDKGAALEKGPSLERAPTLERAPALDKGAALERAPAITGGGPTLERVPGITGGGGPTLERAPTITGGAPTIERVPTITGGTPTLDRVPVTGVRTSEPPVTAPTVTAPPVTAPTIAAPTVTTPVVTPPPVIPPTVMTPTIMTPTVRPVTPTPVTPRYHSPGMTGS